MSETYDRIYTDSYGVNGPSGRVEENTKAIELLCEQLDELRAENRELRRDVGRLESKNDTLLRRVNDLEIGNQSLGEAIGDWFYGDGYGAKKSRIQLIADRVVSYDARFAELHKRLDDWRPLQERLKATLESFERVLKGETL